MPPCCLLTLPAAPLALPHAACSATHPTHALCFQLQLDLSANLGEAATPGTKAAVALLSLRALSPGAKHAWVQQLQAVVVGQGIAIVGGKAAPLPAPLPMRRASSSASEGGEASQHGGAAVPRKISTAVWGEETAPAAEMDGDDEAAAAAERRARDDTLLREIAAQATAQTVSAEEAALIAEIEAAAREYVASSAARLLGLTQRLVSNAMLLERGPALHEGLLDVLLPPGAKAPRADFDDV